MNALKREWEAILPDDPRGQPVAYYPGLVCFVSTGPVLAVVVKDGEDVDSSEWQAVTLAIARLPVFLKALESIANGDTAPQQIALKALVEL